VWAQEDPFKLAILGKHSQHACVTNIDFFFRGEQMAIVAGDDEGVIRVFEYDPLSKHESLPFLIGLEVDYWGSVFPSSRCRVARRAATHPPDRISRAI
jgi:cleavage and polyadenylation specificity factor subunit 1